MRGEHRSFPICHIGGPGSSPHARGAHTTSIRPSRGRGIIPACAGSTWLVCWGLCVEQDHPRMRGEHGGWVSRAWCACGSSPHARGALLERLEDEPRSGIIPACAGSTIRLRLVIRCLRDHPRMRGEHLKNSSTLTKCSGSSPHARGARLAMVFTRRRSRIIPACAGSTGYLLGASDRRSDHPRMRGEHS